MALTKGDRYSRSVIRLEAFGEGLRASRAASSPLLVSHGLLLGVGRNAANIISGEFFVLNSIEQMYMALNRRLRHVVKGVHALEGLGVSFYVQPRLLAQTANYREGLLNV